MISRLMPQRPAVAEHPPSVPKPLSPTQIAAFHRKFAEAAGRGPEGSLISSVLVSESAPHSLLSTDLPRPKPTTPTPPPASFAQPLTLAELGAIQKAYAEAQAPALMGRH